MSSVKEADLAGPGVGDYEELEQVLPGRLRARCSTPRETQRSIFAVKLLDRGRAVRELDLEMVQVPLIVDARERRQRHARPRRLAHARPVPHRERPRPAPGRRPGGPGGDEVEADGAAQFGMGPVRACAPTCAPCARTTSSTTTTARTSTSGTGRSAIRRGAADARLPKETVHAIWRCCKDAETHVPALFPSSPTPLPEPARRSSTFLHAEDLLEAISRPARASARDARSSRRSRPSSSSASAGPSPTATRTSCGPPTTTTGSTETISEDGRPMHGLNGDILVWNPVTQRRHELTSMGIRVDARRRCGGSSSSPAARLAGAARTTGRSWTDEMPLSIGGGIGQSRTQMLLLRKAHLGEVGVTVWPEVLRRCARGRNIRVLE